MRRRIQDSFDSIRLPESSKERIWEEIMDSQRKEYRSVLKRGSHTSWRALPALLVLVITIALGGFLGIRALEGQDTPEVAATVPEDYQEKYADVPHYIRDHVILYDQAISENWPQEEWDRIGLSLELYKVKDRVSCGFIVRDLDGDGLEDLLIYGGSQLYDILVVEYWPENLDLGLPEYTLHSLNQEENGAEMALCEDNVIMLTYVRNDRDTCVSYNRVGKAEKGIAILDTLKTVIAVDGTEWFAGPNEEDVVPISGEEAETIKAEYTTLPVDPKAFSHLRAYLVTYQHQFDGVDPRYLPLLMEYGQALCESWPQGRWMEAGLSADMFWDQDKYWSFEYKLLDLDGDGTEELLIFGDDQLYALYVLRNDQPDERLTWKMHHNSERLSIQLCENNVVKVCQEDATGAIDISFYQVGRDGVGDLSLVMVNNVLYTPDGQWYAGPNAKDAAAVTESEAQALVASYVPVEIEGIPMLNKVRIE